MKGSLDRSTWRWYLLALLLSVTAVFCSATELLVRSLPPGPDVRQRSIRSLLKTRDGYLWIGTGKGLARFDGVSFTIFNAENTAGIAGDDISFNTLWEDNEGVLWAGTYGQGVIRNDHGRFATFQKSEQLADSHILRIDGDKQGSVWVFTQDGVSHWRNGRLARVHPEQDGAHGSLITHDERRGIDFDKMGLWRRTPDGLERFAYGAWQRFPTPIDESRPLEEDVKSIYEDHLRRVWYRVTSQPGRYFCAHDGLLTTFNSLPPEAFVSYQDRAGFLWLNDHAGHPARWKDGQLYPLLDLHTASLLNVVEGLDGAIWAGSFNTDLVEYMPRRISTIPTLGMPEFGSLLFQQRSGTIWAGGTNLLQLRAGRDADQNRVPPQNSFSGPNRFDLIHTLSEDQEGRLIISSRHTPSAVMLDHGRLRPYLRNDLDGSTIEALLLSSSGEQWIGSDKGLYRYREASNPKLERVWSGVVRCLVETEQHTIWAGTAEGPIRYEQGSLRPVAVEPNWKLGEVQAISVDRLGTIWMSTPEHGIVRFSKNGFRAFGVNDGLPSNMIYSVNADDHDDLWVRSDVGLLRIGRRSTDHIAVSGTGKLQVTLLDQTMGLPAPTMQPAGNEGFLRVDRDTLWFSSPGGIASLHPSEFKGQATPPHVVIEEHVIDQGDRLFGSKVVLEPGQSDLELHYTALGSDHPEQVSFRYRLNGFDHGWINARTRRVAYYTQLPPGEYTFEVQAADGNAEEWPSTGAMAQIRVLTPFYRTRWFKVLVVIAIVDAIFFVVSTRNRISADRIRARQAFTHKLIATQEGERKRIAHELHDSIGQHLVLIRNFAMLSSFAKSSGADSHVDAIAEQAAIAIKEVETISYDLRPYQLDRLGLTRAVMSLIQAFERSSEIKVNCSVEKIDGFFLKDMEINFYRIVQEALGNVLRHAQATQVSVSAVRSSHSLRLTIRDNGRGFTVTTAESQGPSLGLVGIHERAEALGGRASIESVPGSGTTVIVEVARLA